jgi:hypothetical protein
METVWLNRRFVLGFFFYFKYFSNYKTFLAPHNISKNSQLYTARFCPVYPSSLEAGVAQSV